MKSVEIAPDSVEAHLMLARVLEAGGRLADAQHHYQEVVRRSSTHLAALTALGRIGLNGGDWKSAISLLERAVEADPGDIDARHFLARSCGLGLRHRHALNFFRTLVGEAPDNPEIRAGFARTLALDGEADQALEEYEQAAKLNPADYKIQQGLSEAYLSVGRKREAEACQRKVLRLDPTRGAAWFQLARMNALSAADIDAIGGRLRAGGRAAHAPFFAARAALPGSLVLICRRHPLDICQSLFSLGFGHQLPFATNLGNIAHKMLQTDRLLEAWLRRKSLPTLEVFYEELVERFEAGARRIVEFAGLPWDERCLKPEEGTRAVLTASAGQIHTAVYRSSVGRWKPYDSFLQETAARLASLIARHERQLGERGLG